MTVTAGLQILKYAWVLHCFPSTEVHRIFKLEGFGKHLVS